MKRSCILACFLVALPGAGRAEPTHETLLQDLPLGYRIDVQTRRGNMLLTEMVPQAETVGNWTEMVTTQIFLDLKNITPDRFQATLAKAWLEVCEDGTVSRISHGEEDGYAFSIWQQSCPLNPTTGKPENTWFKAIEGNDSFYLVHKAFRFEPSDQQVLRWMQYFRSVKVCDSRLADRPCPKLTRVGQ